MTERRYSLILLPTLKCNADCDYCFENKTAASLEPDQLAVLAQKVMDHMECGDIDFLNIYWQGGEVMTLSPEWFERAHVIIDEIARTKGIQVLNHIQSNMIGYNEAWNKVIFEVFGASVGSSLDYPNMYRKLAGGDLDGYEEKWRQNVGAAQAAGIRIGVISIPNKATLDIGPERFYTHFVDELDITDFQLNTPFPGGKENEVKKGLLPDMEQLGRFFIELADIWLERGRHKGVKIGPFDELIDYFINGNGRLPCIWQANCVDGFLCIDPNGHVSQCDCWVASYPEFRFGNIFESPSLSDLLEKSRARRRLGERPAMVVQREDCIECPYLALCHGGCPIRTYSVYGDLLKKDPYCRMYKLLFSHMEDMAAGLAGAAIMADGHH